MRIQLGRISFDEAQFRCKMTCSAVGATNTNPTSDRRTTQASDFNTFKSNYGLSNASIGDKFQDGVGATYEITGCNPRAKKYPIIAKRVSSSAKAGEYFAFTVVTVRNGLMRKS